MTGVPDGIALSLGGGLVLVGPVGALTIAAALERTEALARRDGIRPPQTFTALRQAFDFAATEARGSSAGIAERSLEPDLTGSGPSSSRMRVLVDPVGTADAAVLLRCTPRWVRARCRRGAFASAVRRGQVWLVERDEVVAAARV